MKMKRIAIAMLLAMILIWPVSEAWHNRGPIVSPLSASPTHPGQATPIIAPTQGPWETMIPYQPRPTAEGQIQRPETTPAPAATSCALDGAWCVER